MKNPAQGAAARLRNVKFNRTWTILGVALVIGLMAALGARGYLNKKVAAIEAQGKGKTIEAVVAKVDIAKGVKLSSENVAIRAIPVEFAQSGAVVPADFDRIDGQAIAYPVKAGEMIMWGLMETQRVPTFSARVAAGRRAMTVPVDEVNSISGMLEPGDLIDLMVSIDRAGRKLTFPLMQNVEVLATGQRSVDDPKTGEQRSFSTVTIDTSAQQAQQLIAARETGKLTALLRNPSDKQPIDNRNYDVATLLGMNGARIEGQSGKGVTVLYGGSISGMRPEDLRLNGASRPATAAELPPPPEPSAPPPGLMPLPATPPAVAPAGGSASGARAAP